MPAYRVIFQNVMDGTVYGELPLESFKFGEVLNAPGSFSGTMALDPEDGPVETITPDTLTPWATSVWVERDGAYVWGGPVITLSASVEDNALTVDAEGWHAYFRRRFVRHSRKYGPAYGASIQDQTLIAKDLLDYAQARVGGNVGIITTGATASGKVRDLNLPAYERANIGETIENLADLSGGFHFRYVPDRNPATGKPRSTFTTYYPASARQTDYVFELGVNVELLGLGVDGTVQASLVDTIGTGEGSRKKIVTAEDPALRGVIPLLEFMESRTTVKRESTLEAHAKRRLRLGKTPIKVPELAVHGGAIPSFGSYLVGEVVRVRGRYGYLSLDSLYRITAIDVDVDDNGGEAVTIALAPLEVFE